MVVLKCHLLRQFLIIMIMIIMIVIRKQRQWDKIFQTSRFFSWHSNYYFNAYDKVKNAIFK